MVVQLAALIVLGIGANWVAWRIHLPSIVLLLLLGIVAGPATGLLDPDALLGDLLLPFVSLSVALILFEGGLSLRITELRSVGAHALSLVTIGVAITWLVAAAAAFLLLDLSPELSILLGAILVVSGPTVIGPLLRHIRPTKRVGSLLKWEGIVVDPIGAMLAVIVFEILIQGGGQETTQLTMQGLVATFAVGTFMGAASAGVLILVLYRNLLPDFLHNPVSLMMVILAFTGSNLLRDEAGLFAVTIMGFVVANQRLVAVKHILEFKENLRVLLISSLFILLAARLQIEDLRALGWEMGVFLLVLVFIARPLAVFVSTMGGHLETREKQFLSWMAPRGIVAAAIASIFSLRLVEAGFPEAERLVPITFVVIIFTVVLYGSTAGYLARRLKISDPNPQGILFVGAQGWARELAQTLKQRGIPVLLIDTHYVHVSKARQADLPAHYGSIVDESVLDDLNLHGIGQLVALTPNDEVNSLGALHLVDEFGRGRVFQLPAGRKPGEGGTGVARHLRGHILFGADKTYAYLDERFSKGSRVKATQITEVFTYDDFQKLYGPSAVPLVLIDDNGDVRPFTATGAPQPYPGSVLVALVDDPPSESKATPGEPAAVKTPDEDDTPVDFSQLEKKAKPKKARAKRSRKRA